MVIQLVDELTAVTIYERTECNTMDEIKDRNLTASGLGASDTLANLLKGCGRTDDIGFTTDSVKQFGTHALIRKMNL